MVDPSALEGLFGEGVEPDTGPIDPGDSGGLVDADGDGFDATEDCDDAAPDVFPGALERLLNGVDENCDGKDIPGMDVAALGDAEGRLGPWVSVDGASHVTLAWGSTRCTSAAGPGQQGCVGVRRWNPEEEVAGNVAESVFVLDSTGELVDFQWRSLAKADVDPLASLVFDGDGSPSVVIAHFQISDVGEPGFTQQQIALPAGGAEPDWHQDVHIDSNTTGWFWVGGPSPAQVTWIDSSASISAPTVGTNLWPVVLGSSFDTLVVGIPLDSPGQVAVVQGDALSRLVDGGFLPSGLVLWEDEDQGDIRSLHGNGLALLDPQDDQPGQFLVRMDEGLVVLQTREVDFTSSETAEIFRIGLPEDAVNFVSADLAVRETAETSGRETWLCAVTDAGKAYLSRSGAEPDWSAPLDVGEASATECSVAVVGNAWLVVSLDTASGVHVGQGRLP